MIFNDLEKLIEYIFDKGWYISTLTIILHNDIEKKKQIISRYNEITEKINTFDSLIENIDKKNFNFFKKNVNVFTSLIMIDNINATILYNPDYEIPHKIKNDKNIKMIIKNRTEQTDIAINNIINKNSSINKHIKHLKKRDKKQSSRNLAIKETTGNMIDVVDGITTSILKIYIDNEKINCYQERMAFPNTISFKFKNKMVMSDNKIIFPANNFTNSSQLILKLKKIFKIYYILFNSKLLDFNKVLINIKKKNTYNNFIYSDNKYRIIYTKDLITVKSIDSIKLFDKIISIISSTASQSSNYYDILNDYSNSSIITANKKNIFKLSKLLNNEF